MQSVCEPPEMGPRRAARRLAREDGAAAWCRSGSAGRGRAMEQLQAMGFEAYKCERALAECGQNVEAAVDFVFANSRTHIGMVR